LPQIESARHIFCYLSHDTEVGTHDVIRTLQDQGRDISVSKITVDKQMIAIYLASCDELEPGLWGISSPSSSQIMQDPPDMCITLELGFSLKGGKNRFRSWPLWLLARQKQCKNRSWYSLRATNSWETPCNWERHSYVWTLPS